MSFSALQKENITAQPIKSACCRRAFLQGVLAARSQLTDEAITVFSDTSRHADYISALISEIYSKTAVVKVPSKGGRGKQISFFSQAAHRYISAFRASELIFTPKCPQCKSAFLRGAFLVSGRVSDPQKQYLLEFSVKEAIERWCEVFSEFGFTPRISRKPHETVIYFKSSEQIEDFFALSGMNQAAFAFMDAKIQGELRNNANRVANCEMNNIERAVFSSMHQIELISEVYKRGLISQLPEELEKTARLRMEHSDLSLSQLAAIITPHISKPGLSHRLKKITELCEAILSGNLGNT